MEFETALEAAKAISDLSGSELDGRQIFCRADREDKNLRAGGPGGMGGPPMHPYDDMGRRGGAPFGARGTRLTDSHFFFSIIS